MEETKQTSFGGTMGNKSQLNKDVVMVVNERTNQIGKMRNWIYRQRVREGERKRETDRQRQTDIETEGYRETEKDKERGRERERERERDGDK